ncbi:MAG TPA: EAL domain-containing protein [Steroidobacteraceae bacterium]|jgi:diguanylate cyclase (GGDEF)-like protein/PAS domain S-box-containing protein
MSHESVAFEAVPTLQPVPRREHVSVTSELHPRLCEQLAQATLAAGGSLELTQLLPLISSYYEQLDDERRGIVRSMQLIANEARSFADGLAGADAAHLQAILENIKDVVITVAVDGSIKLFNPTGERVFGYSRSEIVGQPIARLLPEMSQHASIEQGLESLAAQVDGDYGDLRPREYNARHKSGQVFPAELIASRVCIELREVYVICLRDCTERVRTEQALRDSEARYRTLVESAPELIMVLDRGTGRYVDANENALRFFGVGRQRLPDLTPAALSAPIQGHGAPAAQAFALRCDSAAAGEPQVFEWLHRDAEGEDVETEVRLMALPGANQLLRASITDITARRRADKITAGERDVFERIAADAGLSEVLESIVTLIESINSTFTAAISHLGPETQSFVEVIGQRLPVRWRSVEQRLTVDIRNGSSAAAVYLGRPVLVGDIERDPFWQRRREVALEVGFRAAWSVPIKSASGRVLGAVSVYRPLAGVPQTADLELMLHAARLAGIAIERRRAEEALRTSETKFRRLYERVLEGVYQCAPDGRLLEVNPAFAKMLGYGNAEQIYSLSGIAMLYRNPADRAELEQALERHGEIHNAEFVLNCRDGSHVVVLESARIVRDEDQRVIAYEGTIANITARKRAEQAMFAEKERAQVTLQSIGEAVITTDRDGRIDYMNPVAEQLSGWRNAEARGEKLGTVLRLLDQVTHRELENPLVRCLREGQLVHFAEHSVLQNRLGKEIEIEDSVAPIRDRNADIVGAVVVFRDVTKERRLKRALSYQASHDALTGLINRREFDNRLAQSLQGAREGQGPHALLYVDLDQFKVVNDTCGHSAGDRLLRDVTGLLQAHVRTADTIARLGGDEFGILVQHCTAEQAARMAENIRQAILDYRFIWERTTSSIGASIGVVEITQATESVASLLSAADIACYAAKDAGRNRVHLYNSSEISGRHREMYWVSRVTRAVDEGRLELHFQPIVPTGSEAPKLPALCELLVRLRGDDGELVMPEEFIPAAERYNLVSSIDRWVVRRAVEALQKHASGNEPPFIFALNLSGTSLSDRAFLDFVLSLVEEPYIARGLCFEITETAVITSMTQAVSFMHELRKRGCRFALDDFGSGLSSFHYLKTLPVDFLKIDGQFIGAVTTDIVDRSMVEAISRVGRALGIATIAEKVESAAVFAELRRLGVQFAQGYFVAKPCPVETLSPAGVSGFAPPGEAAGVG